jgi:periplasmic protein TonB
VTTTNRTAASTSTGAHTAGWIASLILHGTLVFGAFVFTQQIRLAPQLTPFKWNVAMVTSEQRSMPTPSPVTSADHAPPTTKPTAATPQVQAQAVQPVSPTRPEPAKVEPVQPLTSIVSTPPPPTQPEQRPAVAKPAPPVQAIVAAPTPIEAVVQEPAAARPLDSPSQPAPTEPASLSANREPAKHIETSPATHETFTPPSPDSTPAPVSEPTMTAPPSQPHNAQSTPSETTSSTTAEPQIAALAPTPSTAPPRPDYGWLSDTILRRVEELKRYPPDARLDRAEGKVVLKAVIRADGSVDDVEVYQSSGYRSLDQAAVELMKRAAPIQLPRPLGKAKMTVKIPMSYRLEP